MKKTEAKIALYKHPKMTFKTVWIGAYGGHFNALIFFAKKPKVTAYTSIDNKTVGGMYLEDFQQLYPNCDISELLDPNNDNKPYEIEVSNFIKVKLQAAWEYDGTRIESFDFHAQGY